MFGFGKKDKKQEDNVEEGGEELSTEKRYKEDEPGKGTLLLDGKDVKSVKRGPTDCLCCIFFQVAIVAFFGITYQCSQQAHMFKILYPLDHAGNSCGLGEYVDFPKVYYPGKTMTHDGPLLADIFYSNPKNLWSVCTADCPTTFSRRDREAQCHAKDAGSCTWYSEKAANLYLSQYCIFGSSLVTGPPDQAGTVCMSAQEAVKDVEDEAFQSLDNMGDSQKGYVSYLNTTLPQIKNDPQGSQMMVDLENRLPEEIATLKMAISNAGANSTEKNLVTVCKDALGHQKSYLADFMADVMNSWKIIATCAVLCLYVGAVYLLVMCFFVKTIVWGSVLVCIFGFAFAGWKFWDESIAVADTGLVVAPASEEKILAVICWIFSFLLLVIVFCCRRSLQLAIAISQATSSFLLKNLGVMLLPQLLCIAQLCFVIYWLVGLCAILSTAEIVPADDVTQEFNRFVISGTLKAKIIFHIFVGTWVNSFLEGIGTVAAAITVTDWYYKPKVDGKKPSSHCSFLGGLGKAIVYHSGSVILGSLIISIVTPIKFVFAGYMTLVNSTMSGGTAKCMLACCACCTNCMEKSLKFISFNAYLMIGISGKNFMSSASAATGLVLRHPKRFVILNGVMWTVNVIGRLFIVGVGMVWAATLLNRAAFPSLSKDIHSPWPALLCVVIMSYMMAGIIFGVFTTAGAALFYNFVADEEVCAYSGADCKEHAPGDLGEMLDAEQKRRKEAMKPDEKDEENQKETMSDPGEADP